ncbi:WD repeat-containing protein 17 [Perkinsus olseni]|uniref:WD repeat-containing protein 17 n=1 Tax=Perkinsus olseni TaxID=32597 RepID=A0A7J6SW24_PEROL|nr:WD repeat-containing protein 17 [Perkinsus olseni]
METLCTLPAGAQCWHKTVLATSRNHLAYLSTLTLNVVRISDLTPVDTREITFGSVRDEMLAAVIRNPHGDDEFLVVSSTGRATLVRVEGGSLAPSPGAQEPFHLAMPAGSARRSESVSEILLDFDAGTSFCGGAVTDCVTGRFVITVSIEASSVGDVVDLRYSSSAPLERSFRLSPPSTGSRPIKSLAEGESRPTATVLRPHHSRRRTLGFGWSNGGVTMITVEVGERVLSVPRGTPVVDLAWDPLSTCYILAAYGNGEIVLLDTSGSGLTVESCRFDASAAPIRSVLWQCGSRGPGSFLTAGGDRSTVLQLWNVSKRAPVGEMKETVFDCCFHPRDPNVFCTGSYDGCVKLWRMLSDINGDVDSIAEVVAEMSTATESDGGQPAVAKSKAIVYGVDFSYCGQKIAGVTVKGELHVWRVDTGRRVLLVPPIGPDQPSTYRVSWLKETSDSPRSGWIAFARTDGNALVVDQLQDGRTVAVLDHHSPVFGVAWAPFAEGSSPQLCTAALDGVVRVWSISPTNGVARISHSLRGHEGKAFNVLPHPLLRGIIASGGDDSTIRVWSCSPAPGCLRVLHGHQSKVRALAWHHEVPAVLLSGSWDGTIRVWDVPTGCCIHVHCDHAADVYGLASQPSRPFLFISTSRDSTIKLSTTEWLCRLPVVCALFAEDPLAELASCISTDDRDAILREFLDVASL